MLDIISVMAILDMVMLDILTPPTPMERERLRLNHSFIMEDMEEATMEDIEDTMVATEATMEREMLRLIPNMFMDIILVTAPLDMDIVATHPMHMDTTDKHGSWTNAVPFMLNLILGCLDCLVLYLPI